MSSESSPSSRRCHPAVAALAIAGAGALAWNAARLALALFGPTIPYRLADPITCSLDSEEFIQFLSIITGAFLSRDTTVEVLKNGAIFYPAELEAIYSAQKSIQLEFFEFFEGQVASTVLEALTERARAGVNIHLVVDALGSFRTSDSYFNELRRAGGRVLWYQPVRLKNVPYIDQRTHRKLLVIDGKRGFIGGAGVADHWLSHGKYGPPWRDTMFRVEGRAVAGMAAVLSENWLECSGEILTLPMQGVSHAPAQGATSMVLASTPQEGGTRVRILYQVLLDSARDNILITTPYFLPDRSARKALLRAIRERGVLVRILTNGRNSDHPAITKFSRSLELELLRAGAEIYEYQPGMIHAKLLVIDGQWSVLGSANFDHRSFALNNEVSMAVLDRSLATKLRMQMEEDLTQSRRITAKEIRNRSFTTRMMDDLSWLIRREE
jgi:cardiolipin synthase